MADPKIMVQFRKGVAAGFSKQHIKDSLIEKGNNPTEVNIVMQMLEQEQREKHPVKPTNNETGGWAFVLVIVFIVVGGLLYMGFRASGAKQQAVVEQPLPKPEEVDAIRDVLASLDANQPQKQALLDSTDSILRTNISKEDMMSVVNQNTAKLEELEAGEEEDIAKLKFLVGEMEGRYK